VDFASRLRGVARSDFVRRVVLSAAEEEVWAAVGEHAGILRAEQGQLREQ
jgi:hypothetical protein